MIGYAEAGRGRKSPMTSMWCQTFWYWLTEVVIDLLVLAHQGGPGQRCRQTVLCCIATKYQMTESSKDKHSSKKQER